MKPLRIKIQEQSVLKRSRQDIVEKDYALSYVLAGIAKQKELANSLIFKGGTALKKIFFGDYRFSVDLDFSTLNAPKNHDLENSLRAAIVISSDLLSNYGPFDIQLNRYPERNPHPTGQEAFNINVKFPWHSNHTALCVIKVEVTHDEPVILAPEYKPILHGYNESIDCMVACYHIEEIIAEKLRALLQTHKKLITRGWNRPRARDYYYLWCVLKNYGYTVDNKRVLEVLNKKCLHRDVSYKTIEDFFTDELINDANKHWQATLGNLLTELPVCEHVLEETKSLIAKIITPN